MKEGKKMDQYRQKSVQWAALLRNSEEAPLLCGGCSCAIRDAFKFVFAVLKEDGQFLESFMSGPGG